MYREITWLGLGMTVVGLVVSVVAYNWDVAYGGPMTGLGSAIWMLAALALAALGAFMTLVSVVLGAVARARGRRMPDA